MPLTMDDSPFAKLPGELRTAIYELVLTRRDPITLSCQRCSRGTKHQRRTHLHPLSTTLCLTQTCRQVRHESKLIFFSGNAFVFEHRWITSQHNAFLSAMSKLPTDCVLAMRQVDVNLLLGICFCGQCLHAAQFLRSTLRTLFDAMRERFVQNPQCRYILTFAPCYAVEPVELVLGGSAATWEKAVGIVCSARPFEGSTNSEEIEFAQGVQRRAVKMLLYLRERSDTIRRLERG